VSEKTPRAAEPERPEIAIERAAYRQQMSEMPTECSVILNGAPFNGTTRLVTQ
jgi:hypothetical protein